VHRLTFLLFAFVLYPRLAEQQNVRQVDFKNFTYPLSGNLLGHDSLEWLDTPSHPATKKRTIHLIDGSELSDDHEGFTFQSVNYADLRGDGHEEAIVVLKYHSGGTQTTNFVYIYAFSEQAPKLLAYCHTGSRSDAGLNEVYAEKGLLVFELLDRSRASGDCCSSGVVISRYKWQDGVFKLAGPVTRHELP